jgi:hypothetical protein
MDSVKGSFFSSVAKPFSALFNNTEKNIIVGKKLNFSVEDRGISILRLGTLLCFLAWAWVHFYWEGPYSVLIWNETTYTWAESLGYNWDEVVGTGANDGLFQKILSQLYWGYLICAIMALSARKEKPIQLIILCLGSLMMSVLMYAKYLKANSQLPMFVEHGGQMLMSALLASALYFGVKHKVTLTVAIIAFITTFAGHGCYAMGFWPTPSQFYGMTTIILGFEYETTTTFLRIAGILDFIVCVGILIPKTRWYCAVYATVWGLLTALARPIAGMAMELNYFGTDQFLHESLTRAPHYLIPLFLVLLFKKEKTADQS